ncbi:MAG: hypothetical protein C4617_00430 [Candidatus Liberibacter europaeus]|uniref:Ancillary SecYEG translocon subunit/Cell division coordinator CpoB TPR domain-containing protein n=1 Tax=Candidatus Liberibacter europaeus TaxID=744859 RepID=A0A2T4VYQ7_9HYPH|nr:hypothetical protein [Candidatus Liberibacter europaeus]PTL86924.1 MAG: hypothetical protein C4617_00430 [Candidatus Liberibacter europaeus]
MAPTKDKRSIKKMVCKIGTCRYALATSVFILVILSIATWFYLRNPYDAATEDIVADSFANAIGLFEKNQLDESNLAFDKISSQGDKPYSFLSSMYSASILVKKNDFRGAATKFLAVANDDSIPSIIRDLANISAMQLLVDNMPYDDISKILHKFSNPSSPMHYSAAQTLGLAELKAGNIQKAKSIFEAIANDVRASIGFSNTSKMILSNIAASNQGDKIIIK